MNSSDKPRFTHVIEPGDCELTAQFASQANSAGYKTIDSCVKTDKYGGHRHEWVVTVNGAERLRTDSLAAAIRAYNEVNNEQ